MSRHVGTKNGKRVRKLIEAFQILRLQGIDRPTTRQLRDTADTCNISADIADARALGYSITCEYLTEEERKKRGIISDRKVSVFSLEIKPEPAPVVQRDSFDVFRYAVQTEMEMA